MSDAPPTAPWNRVFLISVAFIGLMLAAALFVVRRERDPMAPWLAFAHADANSAPDSAGNALKPLLEAFDRVDWKALHAEAEVLRAAALRNGSPSDPERVEALLERHQAVFSPLARFAGLPDFRLPTTEDKGLLMARPHLESLELFGFLVVCEARRLSESGRHVEASQRLIELALLGARFCRPYAETTLQGHLAGLMLLELAANALIELASSATLAPADFERLAVQLDQVDRARNSVVAALQAEVYLWADEVTGAGEDVERLVPLIQYARPALSLPEARELAKARLTDALSARSAIAALWKPVFDEFDKPYSARQFPTREEFTASSGNQLATLLHPDPVRYAHREAWAVARLRLARALCLVRVGASAELADVRDPFTGAPVRVGPGGVWFDGPDGDDDGGRLRHDPNAGARADGDITAGFTPSE